ncbi:MAG: hypothetical protein ACTSVC_05490 [Promethearchaeota archaeon]
MIETSLLNFITSINDVLDAYKKSKVPIHIFLGRMNVVVTNDGKTEKWIICNNEDLAGFVKLSILGITEQKQVKVKIKRYKRILKNIYTTGFNTNIIELNRPLIKLLLLLDILFKGNNIEYKVMISEGLFAIINMDNTKIKIKKKNDGLRIKSEKKVIYSDDIAEFVETLLNYLTLID